MQKKPRVLLSSFVSHDENEKVKRTNTKKACLVPRRLSLDENVRAKEGRKERLPSVSSPWTLAVHHWSLAFSACLYHAKNEAPEEEVGTVHRFYYNMTLRAPVARP